MSAKNNYLFVAIFQALFFAIAILIGTTLSRLFVFLFVISFFIYPAIYFREKRINESEKHALERQIAGNPETNEEAKIVYDEGEITLCPNCKKKLDTNKKFRICPFCGYVFSHVDIINAQTFKEFSLIEKEWTKENAKGKHIVKEWNELKGKMLIEMNNRVKDRASLPDGGNRKPFQGDSWDFGNISKSRVAYGGNINEVWHP